MVQYMGFTVTPEEYDIIDIWLKTKCFNRNKKLKDIILKHIKCQK